MSFVLAVVVLVVVPRLLLDNRLFQSRVTWRRVRRELEGCMIFIPGVEIGHSLSLLARVLDQPTLTSSVKVEERRSA